MDLRRARSLCMESYAAPWNFKTNCSLYYSFMTAVNNANPEFMKDLFRLVWLADYREKNWSLI